MSTRRTPCITSIDLGITCNNSAGFRCRRRWRDPLPGLKHNLCLTGRRKSRRGRRTQHRRCRRWTNIWYVFVIRMQRRWGQEASAQSVDGGLKQCPNPVTEEASARRQEEDPAPPPAKPRPWNRPTIAPPQNSGIQIDEYCIIFLMFGNYHLRWCSL